MIYGYARVSTINQELEVQVQKLEEAKCDVIYKEKYTGTTVERKQFKQLLNDLQVGDTLIVTKLDRFARSAKDAMETIEVLFKRGVKVHVLNMGLIEDTPTGRLVFNIMMSFAEFERDMIVERTQEGRAIARQREGYREGRKPKYTKKQIDHALELKLTMSYKEVESITGISKATLVRAKGKRLANKIEAVQNLQKGV